MKTITFKKSQKKLERAYLDPYHVRNRLDDNFSFSRTWYRSRVFYYYCFFFFLFWFKFLSAWVYPPRTFVAMTRVRYDMICACVDCWAPYKLEDILYYYIDIISRVTTLVDAVSACELTSQPVLISFKSCFPIYIIKIKNEWRMFL